VSPPIELVDWDQFENGKGNGNGKAKPDQANGHGDKGLFD
jgi:hypothetical protein